MWRSSEPKRTEQFQQWLDRLARPIEFASRDAFAHLPTVKNLSSFVSSQVMQALSARVYPRAVEAALLKLRELFVEDQQRLSQAEQQRRLQEAGVILGALRQAANDPVRAWQEPEPLATPGLSYKSPAARELWTLPIRFARGVGPKRTAVLQRLRIETVEDALWTVPWRYEDRSVMTPIGNLVPGDGDLDMRCRRQERG
jgi:ATP-dependent DNA helicase RecG